MRRRTVQKITESVIPVILLLSAIFLILLFVQYRASEDAEQAHHIHITAETSAQNISDNEMTTVAEVDFSDDPRIAKAEELIKKGKFNEAENVYFRILANEPSAQLYNWLGMLYLKQEKYNKAVVAFTNALKINPRYYRSRYNRALAYNALGKFDRAVADYKEVIRNFDSHAKSHFNLGLLYYRNNDLLKAKEEFERTAELSAGDRKVKALHMLGKSYTKMSPPQNEKAVAAFTAAIRLKPDHVASRLALIELQYPNTEEGYAGRLEALETLVTLEPENIDIYRAIADVYLAQKKEARALRSLQEGLLHNPDNIDLQFEVIALLIRLKNESEAVASLEKMLTVDPSNAKAYIMLGQLYTEQGAYEAAQDAYGKALAIRNNGSPELWNNLGMLYAKMERFKEAKKAYAKALKLRKEYPEAYYNLGLLALAQKEYKKAEKIFDEAIRLRPDYTKAYYSLAQVLTETQQYQKAIDAYLKVLESDPDSTQAKFNLAVCYTKMKAYDEAVAVYKEILEKDGSYFTAWLNIGLVYYYQKEYRLSEAALEKAVSLEPEDDKANRALANTYSVLKKHDEAIEILERLLEQNPSDVKTRLTYARSYYRAKKVDAALNEYKKVLSLDPENSAARRMIDKIEGEKKAAK